MAMNNYKFSSKAAGCAWILMLALCSLSAQAQRLLAPCFSNNMVLQRNATVALWGSAQPGEEVNVSLQEKTVNVKADKSGCWEAALSSLAAGGPYALSVSTSGGAAQQLDSVYVGEVWLAGGQSNMAFRLDQNHESQRHIAEANNPNVKFMAVPHVYYKGHKVKDSLMVWRDATTQSVGAMSAVAYFFAKKLQTELGVPVGIVCCYKGGTPAEAWMTRESLESNEDFRPILTRYEKILGALGNEGAEQEFAAYTAQLREFKAAEKRGEKNIQRPAEPMGPYNPKRPLGLYETMLSRIIPFTFAGVIWYQGEANASRAEQYRTLFPALIDLWRSKFQNPDMPFLFVQLSSYNHPSYGERPVWAELREAQLLTWQNVKNTAMAVAVDVGEKDDIHPTFKEPVGLRLADAALATVYGSDRTYSGPIYKSMSVKNGKVWLDFTHTGKGLTAQGSVALQGFSICGSSRKFVPAQAAIEGTQVKVWADEVDKPVAVRYGWSNYTTANLFNADGFPASPFRTDNFDLVTKGKK
jgi:sialate O-acetylesterase